MLPFSVLGGAPPPRNVILMIGDGMGLNQLISARYVKGTLAVEGMRHMGVSYTHSIANYVTDSSAGATVLGSGYLIVNGEVGTHPDGSPVKLIVEYAEEKGKWTGLVATCRVTHATPASMATHVKSRSNEDDIALQLAQSDVDVILGGGWDKFLPLREIKIRAERSESPVETAQADSRAFLASFKDPKLRTPLWVAAEAPLVWNGNPYGARKDNRNLIEEMKKKGYRFVRTAPELSLVTSGSPGRLLGLFHSGPMPRATEGRSPSLSAMSLAALKILSQSPKGFFLMIEGSQIDWGGHANDFEYAQSEAADFDSAIDAVLRWLKETGHDQDTLVVVTADHETGGLSLNVHPQLPLGMEPKWTTTYHTATPVPVFASGPLSETFTGILNHERVGRQLIEAVVEGKVDFSYPRDRATAPADTPPTRRF